jgi:hypothetical protein
VLIGSHYSVRLPDAFLRFLLANVLALSGLKLVNVPNVYLGVALALCASGVVVTLVRERKRWVARREERLATGLAVTPD